MYDDCNVYYCKFSSSVIGFCEQHCLLSHSSVFSVELLAVLFQSHMALKGLDTT